MKIFTCKDRFEDIMTCVYVAWEQALSVGHDQVRLLREPIYQASLFDEYVHVDADVDKNEKVVRSIRNSISFEAYLWVYYATLSTDEDALMAIYNFLRLGFHYGADVCKMLQNPYVMKMLELKRRIGNEAHHFREFARFTSLDNQVYVCHLKPKNNVISIVANHFADRMPSEHWMIVDDTRKMAVVHPKDEENYIRYLTDEEFLLLKQTEQREDSYTDMWRGFFHAISIKERENYERQRNMIPIWKRKHAVEFFGKA